jgi:hypothetical protein
MVTRDSSDTVSTEGSRRSISFDSGGFPAPPQLSVSSKVKLCAIVLVGAVLAILLHVVAAQIVSVPQRLDYSVLGAAFGAEVLASIWALLAFSSAADVFHRVQHEISGDGLARGIRYGSAIALLWLMGMLEGVALFGNPWISEFVIGLSDAIPVLIMAVLLGIIVYRTPDVHHARGFVSVHPAIGLGVITLSFLGVRYSAYLLGIIDSGHGSYPVETLLWTLMMGLSIGVAYLLVEQRRITKPTPASAVRFGVVVFGANWFAFLIFIPMLFEGALLDILLRTVLDTAVVTLACLALLWVTPRT